MYYNEEKEQFINRLKGGGIMYSIILENEDLMQWVTMGQYETLEQANMMMNWYKMHVQLFNGTFRIVED